MKQYGLIGFPLGHSFSKRYFTDKFEREGVVAQYELYPLEKIEDFEALKLNEELCGVNVTIPYKEQIFKYLDEVDETAAQIGAVNVVRFDRSEGRLKLIGYNSDAIGFEESIRPLLLSCHKKALILGTGGASKAIAYSLRKMGLQIQFVSRTAKQGVLSYEMLNAELMSDYLVIVNASPVGTFPKVEECPNIPYSLLTPRHLLFDAVYNPAETLFLKKGREMGATGINGEAMLIGQAEAAWRIWNGLDI